METERERERVSMTEVSEREKERDRESVCMHTYMPFSLRVKWAQLLFSVPSTKMSFFTQSAHAVHCRCSTT